MKEIFLDGFMTFGPSINYLFQVFKFNKTKSSKGFSNYLCLITILSHTLKVFFWLTEKFKFTLLIQSILVIIMQLYLIYLCIKYKEKETNYNLIPKNENNIDIKRNYFTLTQTFNFKLIWKWDNILEYYKFYFFIIILLSLFYSFCNNIAQQKQIIIYIIVM
jgi:hypothetical protein